MFPTPYLVRVVKSDAPVTPEQVERAFRIRLLRDEEEPQPPPPPPPPPQQDRELRPSGGDDYPAIQAAIDEGRCALGAGSFILSDTLSVTDSVQMEGRGKLASSLNPPPGKPAIVVNVPREGYSTVFSDFGIIHPGFQSGVSGIAVGSVRGEHVGFEAHNLWIQNAGYGINFRNASYWRITGTMILNSTNAAVLVRNTNHPDSGDAAISDCWFINPSITSGGTIGIWQFSGGGLRVDNTKLNLFNQAYQMALDANVHTCDLLFSNCSMESVGFSNPNAPILLQNPSGSGSFHSVVVIGNQFNGWNYSFATHGGVINCVNNNPAWCHHIVVGSNAIN